MDYPTFIEHIANRLRCDVPRAESVANAVLRELRDRLTPKEARDVAAQLPKPLKRIWEENEHADRVVTRTHLAEFVGRIRQAAALPDDHEAERAAKAVFAALQALLGSPSGKEGEAWDIFSQLPKDLKMLWLAAGDYPKVRPRADM